MVITELEDAMTATDWIAQLILGGLRRRMTTVVMTMHRLGNGRAFTRLATSGIRLVYILAFVFIATATQAADRTFSIPFADLQAWSNSITISLENVTILGRSGVHPVADDCEMHFGARVEGYDGTPPGWVLEPMNVCVELFPGKKKYMKSDWLTFGDSIVNKKVTAIGVPRIWPEHLVGGNETSNPNHAVELHPLTKLVVGQRSFDFSKQVFAPDGFSGGLSEATALKLLDPDETEVTVTRSGDNVEIDLDAGRIGNFTTLSVTLLGDNIDERPDGYRLGGRVAVAKGKSATVAIVAAAGSAAFTLVKEFKSSGRATIRVDDALVLFSLNPKALVEAARNDARDVKVENPIQLILYGVNNK